VKPPIPKGWRELKEGEPVVQGDRYYNDSLREFVPSVNFRCCGGKQGELSKPYIRRITACTT